MEEVDLLINYLLIGMLGVLVMSLVSYIPAMIEIHMSGKRLKEDTKTQLKAHRDKKYLSGSYELGSWMDN